MPKPLPARCSRDRAGVRPNPAIPALPGGVRLLAFDRLDSTNLEARRLAEAGEPLPAVVWAREQGAGRGRRGRRWASPPGNLYASLVFHPGRPIAESAQLSFAAALAAGDAVEALLPMGRKVGFKWPNDVLIDGAKVAGLLLEAGPAGTGPSWLVVGAGINLASHPEDTPYPATDCLAAGGRDDVEAALVRFVEGFLDYRHRWQQEGFEPIRRLWLARAQGQGGPVRVALGETTITGIFDGLDETGALLIAAGGSRRTIAAGDVLFGVA
jgi:BirA family biotin operon repressor/biotin-[acetyl-CoA-carboxylase] ligase